MASNITAQSVLEEISQDHLECPICTERFKQPKLLKCFHSFCLECLQYLRQKSPSSTRLSCPVCRQETLLKENGIDDLATDFKSISLIAAFEKQETHLKQQQGNQVPSQEFVSKCSKHTCKDLIMYCETCKKLICTTCIAKDHRIHSALELKEASDKSKQHATELLAEVRQSITTFNIAIQEIDMSCKTLNSMFAATKEKISKKADEESAKMFARIREEKQKLMQEAEQIYKDRVKIMEIARASNSELVSKAELKQDEVLQLMDRQTNIVHHIEQLLQDLIEYREMKTTNIPVGLTYMDFKEGQKSLGRLMLKEKWTLKTIIETPYPTCDVSAFSDSDIVVSGLRTVSWISISAEMAENNPEYTVSPLEIPIRDRTSLIRVTVNKNDELIVLDNGIGQIFNRNYQLLHQFKLVREQSCIAVDDNNLIAVGYSHISKISLHKPDGSLIRTLPARGIDELLTTYKQQLIYINSSYHRLISVDYNGIVVFLVDINQSWLPRGVCCDKNGNIYVAVRRGRSSGDIHNYSSDGKYIGCIITSFKYPTSLTVTPAGDLVLAQKKSVEIYQHD